MAWHSSKTLDNQMLVLEQFDLLPIMLLSTRYNEMIDGGVQGSRWQTLTQSLHKETGKLVFDSGARPSTANPQFDAFSIDLRCGTINLFGFSTTIQHYIDDGRKVELPKTAVGVTSPNPYTTPPLIRGDFQVLPAIVMPVQPIVRERAPLKLNIKKVEKR